MDIKVNDNFDLIFNYDLHIIDGILEQKQRLFIFINTLKGSIPYALGWGLDYLYILKVCKLGNLNEIKSYFYNIANQLQINITGIKTVLKLKTLHITFYFPGDLLETVINT
ncbi:hypothetical protein [Borrelia miyamotoi]|uniref:Uncharacterized protein n=1 Tax=Borrelia miyamotoi TaxID=47466 RepID=A0AAQ2WXY3_9SPIR|nr:hypothetical protein [Borrelia miyamotoi]AOW96112.1 hypothetical protein AXH25_05390 [Borrelia miyamotoi]AOW96118.1 hypothetical protein AXH25_05420 [Borrelia miyamotoi]AOW96160.1 hypothetical protein AXH25_05640 [Borrelia miyamotoi]AOW96209.1 hypothetical protein AXH25_05965 [Borrelia miyamotoi]QTL84024.1 hypothetical protein bmLB2001_001290 [Borrelia miyamotoi]